MSRGCEKSAKEIARIMGKTRQAVQKRAKKESWPAVNGNGKGGAHLKYPLASLPQDVQLAIYNKEGAPTEMIPHLAPAVALAAMEKESAPPPPALPAPASLRAPYAAMTGLVPERRYAYEELPAWSPERAISPGSLTDERIGMILAVIRDVEAQPRGWQQGKDAWVRHVAAKHVVARQTIYRWLAKYDQRGIAGIEHRKSSRDNPKAWTPEALDWWIGLCLKPAHRKMELKSLYEDILVIEASRRGWRIGGRESACWWFRKRATPTMLALRDGGMRALDNMLAPILRDYSDLAPFEILVGDQHRFDFWVIDDDTGKVFRPECFAWQDLRTRLIYGMAFDRHYDAHLCGLALWIGMRIWGGFVAIYTDNGRPELSQYMMGIMAEIRRLGMEWERTEDLPLDILDVDAEEIDPVTQIAPGTHKKAIVKNAKAKMIEGTYGVFEDILRSRFRLPGSVKRLTDDIHTQDVDQQEAMKLADQGRLMLASEFYLVCYRAIDYYNKEKAHRGVKKEWAWKPVPPAATPMDCLAACYADGWRPKMISPEAADMIFLKKASLTVRHGRITLNRELYEHDLLLNLHGRKVDCRWNPIEADIVLVYHEGQFLCAAFPVEYSSMKEPDQARQKIVEKREKRKKIAESFREITSRVPDFREYSSVPETEKVAALVAAAKEQKRLEHKPVEMTQEDLTAAMTKLEAGVALPAKRAKPLPPRPGYFLTDFARFDWCIKYEAAGGELAPEDRAFLACELAKMSPTQRERWEFEREYKIG